MAWQSTKTYGHEEGLSVCFRQWRAKHSHCQYLHGYALSFSFVFEAYNLDERQWVMDFGGLRPLRDWLHCMFDHKTLVAFDDPQKDYFGDLANEGLADVVFLPEGQHVGAERFAEMAGLWVQRWLSTNYPKVRCVRVECREHGANSGVWTNP